MLAHWINERWNILRRKEAHQPEPWTEDPVLLAYRFCNVRREDDRTTRSIAKHWRAPNHDNPLVWHAMIVARMLNHPPSLHAIGYPEPWDSKRTQRILLARQARDEQVFGGAYKIGTGGQSVPKIPYIVERLDRARTLEYPPRKRDTLAEAHRKLMEVEGLGNFMAAQVVADVKHTALLADAADWWDWAAPGPGSLKGLGWLETGRLEPAGTVDFVRRLRAMRALVEPRLDVAGEVLGRSAAFRAFVLRHHRLQSRVCARLDPA